MKTLFTKIVLATMLFGFCGTASAQKWLQKLEKATEKVSTVTDNLATAADSAIVASDADVFCWDSIPQYHAEKILLTDEEGNVIKNEDGTDCYRVFLVDQYGNKRSTSAVEAQQKQLRGQIGQITKKVGKGAAVGAFAKIASGKSSKSDIAKGAVTGALTGALASLGNMENVKNISSSLKEQKALVEAYSQNFTEEGEPVDASVDPESIEDLGLKDTTTLSQTAASVQAELESEEFNNASNDLLDNLDSIIGAA